MSQISENVSQDPVKDEKSLMIDEFMVWKMRKISQHRAAGDKKWENLRLLAHNL